jgi:SAM-dependent methyltransferase
MIRPDRAKIKRDHERLERWKGFESVPDSDYDQFIVQLLDPAPANLVLDAGTGNGRFAEYISRLGCTVVAVDVNRSILSVAKQNVDSLDVEFMVADISSLPIRDCVFDRILCVHNLWYIREYDKAISSMIDSLNDNGLMVIDHLNLFASFGLTYFFNCLLLILRRRITDIGRRKTSILKPFLGRGATEVSCVTATSPLTIEKKTATFATRFIVAFRKRQTRRAETLSDHG